MELLSEYIMLLAIGSVTYIKINRSLIEFEENPVALKSITRIWWIISTEVWFLCFGLFLAFYLNFEQNSFLRYFLLAIIATIIVCWAFSFSLNDKMLTLARTKGDSKYLSYELLFGDEDFYLEEKIAKRYLIWASILTLTFFNILVICKYLPKIINNCS